MDAYLEAVSAQSLSDSTLDRNVSIIYTPLNGAGRYCVTRILKENGFDNITVVQEQELPDGNFPTCPNPNPELPEAMELGIKYARRTGSELLLATDPDCDRVGIAVKDGQGYTLLTGNETGMLLSLIHIYQYKHSRIGLANRFGPYSSNIHYRKEQ